jgi:hypothetical protein
MFHFPQKYIPKRKLFPFTTSTIHEKTPPCHRPQTERNLGPETYFSFGGCIVGTLGVRCVSLVSGTVRGQFAQFVHDTRTFSFSFKILGSNTDNLNCVGICPGFRG